jgi:competence protein ComEA
VSGAVNQSGVYSLPPDSIVQDAITAAGGTAADADLNRVNLAQVLHDGDQIHVPRIGEVPTSAPVDSDGGNDPVVPSGPININTATQAEFESLPGIGPAIAQRIIDYRETNGPFTSIDQLQNVSGIGPAIFDQIKDLVTVE